jgi:hypothetical protein
VATVADAAAQVPRLAEVFLSLLLDQVLQDCVSGQTVHAG